ncbi:MAG: sugar transferase [Candidatus Omnitrophota bacterium]|nr:sugar transferase [Candidatus Omnitrophota bacterium]
MKRVFDFIMAGFLLVILSIPMLIIGLVIKLTSKGPALYWSDRVGIDNKIFKMPKFRTMRLGAPTVATHLFQNPDNYITPFGEFLRKFSLDELPQLFNIISGDMTFVGPRPALFNQYDLIELRTKKNIHKLSPGVTGWAQVNGRDSLPIPVKVEFDEYYLKNKSLLLDGKILVMTIIKSIQGEGVHH